MLPKNLFSNSSFLALIGAALISTSCNNTGNSADEQHVTIDIPDTVKVETPKDTLADENQENAYNGPDISTTASQLAFMEKGGAWERYKTGILPQMAQEVPEYCEKLLKSTYDHFLIVDKNKMKIFLYDKYGNIVKSYGIACARNYGTKHVKGDSRTAEGFFSAEGIYDSTNWKYTNDRGYTSPARGVYGKHFIRVDVPGWRCIGIHGTNAPYSIGNRASHGCIRMNNESINEMIAYAKKGMPIIISPGPRDMSVNQSEGYNIPSVSTEPGDIRAVAGQQAMAASVKAEKKAEAASTASKPKTETAAKKSEPVAKPAPEKNTTSEPKAAVPAVEHKEAPAPAKEEAPKAEPAPKTEPAPAVKESPAAAEEA